MHEFSISFNTKWSNTSLLLLWKYSTSKITHTISRNCSHKFVLKVFTYFSISIREDASQSPSMSSYIARCLVRWTRFSESSDTRRSSELSSTTCSIKGGTDENVQVALKSFNTNGVHSIVRPPTCAKWINSGFLSNRIMASIWPCKNPAHFFR
jgi:hypothetical protein